MDASIVAHGTLGKMADYLWARQRPTKGEVEHITEFCIRAATTHRVKQ